MGPQSWSERFGEGNAISLLPSRYRTHYTHYTAPATCKLYFVM